MAKKTKKAEPANQPALEGTLLPALPEVDLTRTDSGTLLGFLGGLVPFFTGAQQLEVEANHRLERAKLFTLPAIGDADADARLQVHIKESAAGKKQAAEYWKITSVVHRFHGMLTKARDRAVDADQESMDIAQRLHNTYKQREERLAADREEARRREAEAEAQKRRDEEIAALEAAAVAAEAASADLSEREQRFVERVFAGVQPTAAARAVGYKNPEEMGARLMTYSKIVDAVAAKRQAEVIRQQAQAAAEAPLEVVQQPIEKAAVRKVGVDRTTYSANLKDERLLIEAILGGKHGIPSDILMVNPTKLNEYARSLQTLINRWPGVELVTNTRTV